MTKAANREILFVLGSARSGTTFLNNFLDRWFDYGMGPEGTLEIMRRMYRDSKKVDVTSAEILARVPEPSYAGVVYGIFRAIADTTQSFDGDVGHFVGDGVVAVASQAIDTGPHQEMRADLLGRAEKFVDVALAVADMDAAPRVIQ